MSLKDCLGAIDKVAGDTCSTGENKCAKAREGAAAKRQRRKIGCGVAGIAGEDVTTGPSLTFTGAEEQ
jgi:hypothetical protein